MADASFFGDGEETKETNEKLGSLTQITKELAESNSALIVLKKREVATIESNQSNLPAIVGDSQPHDPKGTPVKPTTPPVPLQVEVAGGTLDKDAGGAAGAAEEEQEESADDEERTSLLKKMAGYLGDQAKRAKRFVVGGLKAFFTTIAIGGFLIALGAFLQSPYFPKMIDFIKTELMPAIEVVWKWVKKIGKFIAENLTEVLIALGVLLGIGKVAGIYLQFKRMKLIFGAIKALQLAQLSTTAGTMLVPEMAAKGGFIARLTARFVAMKTAIAAKGGLLSALGAKVGGLGLLGKLVLLGGVLAGVGAAFFAVYKLGELLSSQRHKIDAKTMTGIEAVIAKGDKATLEELKAASQKSDAISKTQSQLASNPENNATRARHAKVDAALKALIRRKQEGMTQAPGEGASLDAMKKEVAKMFNIAAMAGTKGTAAERTEQIKAVGENILQKILGSEGFKSADAKTQKELLTYFARQESRAYSTRGRLIQGAARALNPKDIGAFTQRNLEIQSLQMKRSAERSKMIEAGPDAWKTKTGPQSSVTPPAGRITAKEYMKLSQGKGPIKKSDVDDWRKAPLSHPLWSGAKPLSPEEFQKYSIIKDWNEMDNAARDYHNYAGEWKNKKALRASDTNPPVAKVVGGKIPAAPPTRANGQVMHYDVNTGLSRPASPKQAAAAQQAWDKMGKGPTGKAFSNTNVPKVNAQEIVNDMRPRKALPERYVKRYQKDISKSEDELRDLEKELAASQMFIESRGAGGKDTVTNLPEWMGGQSDVDAERGDIANKKSVIAKKKQALAEKKAALRRKMGLGDPVKKMAQEASFERPHDSLKNLSADNKKLLDALYKQGVGGKDQAAVAAYNKLLQESGGRLIGSPEPKSAAQGVQPVPTQQAAAQGQSGGNTIINSSTKDETNHYSRAGPITNTKYDKAGNKTQIVNTG